MVIKKVFKFQVCQSKISNVEKALLDKYEFKTLESMTMNEMYHELALLQKWAFVGDEELQNDYNGYKALDQYLREISKFRTANDLRTLNI